MLLLALDTSTSAVSVALWSRTAQLACSHVVDAQAHGEILAPGVRAVFAHTYKPPMKGAALWLWLLPPILLLVLILGWLRYVNQRKRERYAQRLTDHEQVRLQQILGQHRKDSAP